MLVITAKHFTISLKQLLGLLILFYIDIEDGGSLFLRNIDETLPDCAASHLNNHRCNNLRSNMKSTVW
jgi:hypothetical protein